jgi:hypothetical protein
MAATAGACAVFLWFSGYSLVSQQRLVEQQARTVELEAENGELSEDLFRDIAERSRIVAPDVVQ